MTAKEILQNVYARLPHDTSKACKTSLWDKLPRDIKHYVLQWRNELEQREIRKQQVLLQKVHNELFNCVHRYHRNYHHYTGCVVIPTHDLDLNEVWYYPINTYITRNKHGNWVHAYRVKPLLPLNVKSVGLLRFSWDTPSYDDFCTT